MNRVFVAFVVSLSLWAPSAPAAPKEPTGDGKLVKPYEGAIFDSQEELGFMRIDLPAGPADTKGDVSRYETLEGYVTFVEFRTDATGRSTLEMARNYSQALEGAGFKVLFTCSAQGKTCGRHSVKPILSFPNGEEHYLLARGSDPATGDRLTVAVRAAAKHFNQLIVVRHKAMDTGMVKVDAAAIGKGLAADGHLALYGIQFDFGKASLKPESAPVLAEVAALLAKSPALKLHVVGHTDNVGDFDANLTLSRARAAAVVDALVKQHGIAAGRLRAHGVSSVAPVSTNRGDAGRAQNRRVELVEM